MGVVHNGNGDDTDEGDKAESDKQNSALLIACAPAETVHGFLTMRSRVSVSRPSDDEAERLSCCAP